jgi:hypothetical protein
MDEVARAFLKHPREDRSLVGAFLQKLLRVVKFPDLPDTFHPRFWPLRKAYLANAWPEVIDMRGVRYIIALLPEVTRRPLASFGDVFVLFTHMFACVRTIAQRHGYGYGGEDFTRLIKFVSLNSEFAGILRVFLLFDTFVLQNRFFISTLDEHVLQNWNAFSQIMVSMIVQDQSLSADVSAFVTAEGASCLGTQK